jgi:hypothetical protein
VTETDVVKPVVEDDPPDFAAWLTQQARGKTNAELSEALRTLVAACIDTGKKGSLRLTITVAPDGDHLIVTDEIAEFVEQHVAAFAHPEAATMLEVSRTFTAARDVAFDQKVTLTSGDVQLKYTEQSQAKAGAKGTIEVPKEFLLWLAPYLGVQPVEVKARLRWRLRDGELAIGYQLHRPDLVEREAFSRIVAGIVEAAEPPLFWGTAPGPVR